VVDGFFAIFVPKSRYLGKIEFWDPPNIFPNLRFLAPEIFFSKIPRRPTKEKNFTVLSLTGTPREPVKFSDFSDSADFAEEYGKMEYS